jgi:hypothetical protein
MSIRLARLLLFVLLTPGCGRLFNQHTQMMDAMRGVMADTAARLGETGSGQVAAGGHVVNPGIRVAGGVEYYAVARYEGLSGQVSASMSGRLDRPVPPEIQQQADRIWRNTELTTDEKLRLVARLLAEWADTRQSASQRSALLVVPEQFAPSTHAKSYDDLQSATPPESGDDH